MVHYATHLQSQAAFKVQAAQEEHKVLRSASRSPGCTPVIALGGTPSARVRMHSQPGHDNFAPMRSADASPGSAGVHIDERCD